jgi:hypothetical protein
VPLFGARALLPAVVNVVRIKEAAAMLVAWLDAPFVPALAPVPAVAGATAGLFTPLAVALGAGLNVGTEGTV